MNMNLYSFGVIFIFVSSFMSSLISSVAVASPTQLTYQGRILKTDGTPLSNNNVSFIFQIKGGPNEQCLIYQEQVNGIDLSNSNGVFDVPIGTGSISYPTTGSFTILDAFNNSTPSFDCGTCSVSGGTVTCNPSGSHFNPAVDDIRTLKVQFYDGIGWKSISPSSIIRSVPFAGYSLSAQKLGTNTASDFILKNDVNNPGTGSVSCNTGNFLTWDASTGKFGCAGVSGASGGTVKTVTASAGSNPYLTVSVDSTNPVITLNVGTVAGTVAAGNDSRLVNAMQSGAAAGGDLSGTYPNPTVAKINGAGLSFSTLADGQFLRHNGTNWINAVIQIADVNGLTTQLGNKIDASKMPANCSAGQTLTFSAPTGFWTCSAIAVTEANITGTISGAKINGDIAGNAAGFTGALAGDVTGTQGATKVVALQGKPVAITAPGNNEVLTWNGSAWAPAASSGGTLSALTGDVTASGSGSVAATVNAVGGSTAANVHSAELAANAATNANTASTIIKRDASGNFIAAAANLNSVVLKDSATNTVTLQAPTTVGTSYVLKMPTAQGGASQFLTNDGAGNLYWSASSTGVTSLAVTAPITNSGTASVPNIGIQQASGSQDGFLTSADWTTFNTKLSSALNSANIWVGNGSNVATPVAASGDISLASTGAFTVTKIQTMPVSATTPNGAGQVLRYNGTTQYVATFLNLSDIHSSVTPASTAFPATSCTAKQTLTWISLNDTLACTTIAIDDSQIAFTTSRAANTILAGPDGSAGAATFRALTAADLPVTGANGVYANGGNSFGTAATLGTNDNNSLTFKTNNANQVTIAADGKVGIGTTAPSKILDIQAAGSFVGPSLGITNTAGGASTFPGLDISKYGGVGQPRMRFTNSGGTFAAPTATASGNTLGNIDFLGYGDTGLYYSAAIRAVSEAAFTDASSPASIRFLTTSVGANSQVERLRIDPSGKLGVGTMTPTAMLHLKAGTAALNTAPLKLTSGINLATPEAGAVEYDGTNLYFTDSTAARRTIATTSATTYSGVSSISNSGGNITLAPNATTGSVLVTSTTASTGSANGALVVSGGAGFAGDIYSAASINAATTMSALTSILTPQLYGSASASGDIKIDGTSHATKGNVLLSSVGGKVGIGVSTVGATTGALEIAGTSSSGSFVFVNPTMTNATTGSSVINAYNSFAPSSAPGSTLSSNAVSTTVTTGSANANANTNLNGISTGAYYWNASGTIGTLNGAQGSATNQAGGTVNIARGTTATSSNLGAGTITSAFGVDAAVQNTGTGTITNAYAVRANGITNTGGGTVTTAHGLYIGKQNGTGVTASYGIYQADAGDKSYFAGNIGVGTTSPTASVTAVKSSTATTGTVEGVYGLLSNTPASASSAALKAGHFAIMHSTASNNTGTLDGVMSEVYNTTAATLTTANGFNTSISNTSSGTFSAVNGVNVGLINPAAGTMTTAYGFNLATSNSGTMTTHRGLSSVLTNSGTLTNSYDLYLDVSNTGTITNQYGVYQNSANSKNYFAGNVGIGTAAPTGTLEVAGGTAAASTNGKNIILTAQTAGTGNQNGGNIILMPGAKTGTGTGGMVSVGSATPPSWVGANGLYIAGSIAAGGDFTAGSGYRLGFGTGSTSILGVGASNATDNLIISTQNAERMRITSAGYVGISNTAPSKLLHVGSATVATGTAVANFQNIDGTCTITPAASGSGIACSSDERLKENFQDIQGSFALDKILKLQAVTYNFKTASTETRRTGYKAQEVQKIAPEFVRQNDDGYLQVYYDAFIPWITESIKTLYGRITGIEARQATQERMIASVQAENADKDKVIHQLKQENAAIKAYLCSKDKKAAICK